MKNGGMRSLKRWLLMACCGCLSAMNAEDPFSCFSTSVDKNFPTLRRTIVLKDKFVYNKKNWRIDSTFPGTLSCDNGLVLTPAKRNNREYGIALKLYRSIYPIGGKKYEFSTLLSGQGKAKIGMIIYAQDRNGRPVHRIVWSEECDLGQPAKKMVIDADCSRMKVHQFGLLLHINAGGKLICREVELCEIGDSSVNITSPYLLLVKKGDPLPRFGFDISRPDGDKHDVVLLSSDDNNVNSSSLATPDENGRVYPPPAVINTRTGYTLSINGTTSTTYVLPISAADYERCDESARKIRLKKPLKIVVFSDSQLDKDYEFNVGCGACEQLFFWLDKYNHGLVTIKNLAVRGDDLQRVHKRMRRELGYSKERTFKQRVFAGMFKDDVDLVFIQFGSADAAFRTLNSEADGPDNITAENIKQPLDGIIKICGEHWRKATVIVFSSPSCCENVCRKRHRNFRKQIPGRVFALYGVPACLEKYNMIAKSSAQASGAMFYDIYSGMKSLPDEDKVKLFHPIDGVHLSHAGHVYMTIKYLELLGDVLGTSQ